MEELPAASPRLLSLDTFRGVAMSLIALELLRLPDLAAHFPDSAVWRFIGFHMDHVVWTGCSLHDLIQPAFSFMVGVALPFSLASRLKRGQTRGQMTLHALWRAALLVAIGVGLRFLDEKGIYWTFEDTLSQIGLGYPLLFLLGFASQKIRWLALAAVLGGYWLLFATYSPPLDWSPAMANVPADWAHDFTGFAAHWNLNQNAAWAFDRWLLNLLPSSHTFSGNPEGYSTLSFIPTLGTMILGLIAGQWFRDGVRGLPLLRQLLTTGAFCIITGIVLHRTGVCPAVKKIWTPSWTLFSGGWCLFIMAIFHLINDMLRWNRWSSLFLVLGMNSILMYILVHLAECFLTPGHYFHFNRYPFTAFGPLWEPTLHGLAVTFVLWSVIWFLHRKRIFLRI